MLNLTTKKIAKNTLYQLVGKVFTMGVTVLVTVLITRGYGRELYGDFSLMQGIPALFFIITDFGLNAISVREVSKNESKIYHYFVNVLIFRVVLSLIFIILVAGLLQFFPYSQNLKFGIRLGLLLILTFSLHSTTNIIFQTKLRYDLSVLGQSLGYVLILGVSFFLVLSKAPVAWINFSYVIGGLLSFLINFSLIKKLGISTDFYLDLPLIKSLFKESLPLGIMFVFSQMNFKEDALLISVLRVPKWLNMSHSEAVGVYALPYKIFEVALVVPTFFMNAVYPVLVRHMQEGEQRLLASFRRVLIFLASSGIVCGLLGAVFASQIISIFGGAEFYRSIAVLQILVGGVFVFYLTQPLSWLIITLGKQIYLPYIYLASVAFNLIFNLVFIPRYSFYAAATITIVSEFLILVLLSYFAVKSWKARFRNA